MHLFKNTCMFIFKKYNNKTESSKSWTVPSFWSCFRSPDSHTLYMSDHAPTDHTLCQTDFVDLDYNFINQHSNLSALHHVLHIWMLYINKCFDNIRTQIRADSAVNWAQFDLTVWSCAPYLIVHNLFEHITQYKLQYCNMYFII